MSLHGYPLERRDPLSRFRAAFDDDDNIGNGEVWISFVLHLLGLLYDGPVNPIPIAENY
jgi:hypothetical protein